MKLEAYALIGDLHTAALVGSNGSIDWLCLPRFDSGACFAALLGSAQNGCWRIGPKGNRPMGTSKYREDTLVVETEFATETGVFRVVDFMPPGDSRHDVVRIVEGLSGRVPVEMELRIRFDYGETIPWVHHADGGVKAVAGPNALLLHSDVETRGEDLSTRASFEIAAGEKQRFVLTWFPSHERAPVPIEATKALAETEAFWRKWSSHCTYRGPWREAVMRSLIVLKALTYEPTGGIVAAPTTSLPEQLGGVRNWDYRFCWLRDATFTLYSLMQAGYSEEANAWSLWLQRAMAGDPAQLQMLYGAAGERSLPELELPHLAGYENSRPVRIGNGAARQFQLDVYGEILDAMQLRREIGLPSTGDSWHVQLHLIEFVVAHWQDPDEGIWEVRGPRRHFTHSKVMAWVALDRAVKAVERFKREGPVEHWRAVRQAIHEDVCARGFNQARGTFTQYYGGERLDASLLLVPIVGFLPPDDPRVVSTIRAIQDELMVGGLVCRYAPESSSHVDGMPPGEGAFLPCSFWLVDCLCMLEQYDEAEALFKRLLALRTPLGLLAEEFDTRAGRLVGNFPQAFSHVALINSAQNLTRRSKPAVERSAGARSTVKADEGQKTPKAPDTAKVEERKR